MKRIAIIAIVVIFGLAIIDMVMQTRRLQRRSHEQSRALQDVRGIVENLSLYNDINKRLPPAIIRSPDGKPLCSWRFANAAFLLCDQVQYGYYGEVLPHIDRPWNSAENHRYLSGPYRDYGGSPLSYIDQSRPGNKARFVAVLGPGTAFEEGKPCTYDQLPRNMILVVETRGADVHWMEPGGDLDILTIPREIGAAGGISPAEVECKEFFVGFADGQVLLLKASIPFETLERFLTIAEAAKHDREAELGPYSVRAFLPHR